MKERIASLDPLVRWLLCLMHPRIALTFIFLFMYSFPVIYWRYSVIFWQFSDSLSENVWILFIYLRGRWVEFQRIVVTSFPLKTFMIALCRNWWHLSLVDLAHNRCPFMCCLPMRAIENQYFDCFYTNNLLPDKI